MKTDLKPRLLFCNVTISNLDFMPYSLYSNRNTYVIISRSQISCMKSILDNKSTCTEVYTSILDLNLSILRELSVYKNIQLYNEHCIRNCSTESLRNLGNTPSGGLPEGMDTVLPPTALLWSYDIENELPSLRDNCTFGTHRDPSILI